jgi:rod shape-determining protein MreD
VLVFVIFFALLNGENRGTFYGLFCGLLEDLYTGRIIGTNAISKAITAFIVGKLQGNVFKENVLVGVTAVAIGTMINSALFLVLAVISLQNFSVNKYVFTKVLFQIIYNTIITAPIYIWYYRSSRRGLLKETGDR